MGYTEPYSYILRLSFQPVSPVNIFRRIKQNLENPAGFFLKAPSHHLVFDLRGERSGDMSHLLVAYFSSKGMSFYVA